VPPAKRRAKTLPDVRTLDDLIRIPPFHNWLRLRVTHVERGRVAIVLPYRDELIGNPHIPAIHGGILAGLIDLAGGAALFTLTYAPNPTIDMRVDYVRPAKQADTVAEAHVVNAGKTVAFVDVEVTQEGRLVATGRATYSTKNARPAPAPGEHPIG
jgi:uncharacterized protein (TIGR00369 family)